MFSGVGTGFGVEIGVRSGVGFAAGVATFGWRFGCTALVGFGAGVETGLPVGAGETRLGGTFVFGGGVVPGLAVGAGETRLDRMSVLGEPVGVVPGLAVGAMRLGGTLIFGEPAVPGLPVGDGVITLGGKFGCGLVPGLRRPGGKLPVGRALGLPPGLTGEPEGVAAAATNWGVGTGAGLCRFCGTGFCCAIAWRSWVAWFWGTFCHPRWITGLGICWTTVGRTLEIARSVWAGAITCSWLPWSWVPNRCACGCWLKTILVG